MAEQLATLLEHYADMLAHHGTQTGVRLARKHIAWYSKGLPGSAEFRSAINRVESAAEVAAQIDGFYRPCWISASKPRAPASRRWAMPRTGSRHEQRHRHPSARGPAAVSTRPAPLPDCAAILAALPMPAVVLDAENRFRYVNPAAE